MITPEQFYDTVNQSFSDLRKTMYDNHVEVRSDIKDLCTRFTKIEGDFTKHIAVGEAIKGYKAQETATKDKKVYYVMGVITAVFTAFETLKSVLHI